MEANNSIHFASKSLIMGRNQGRSPLAAHQIEEFSQNNICRILVKISGGLIRQNQLGPVCQSARHGNPLLLPA